ncbi:Uncharacterised protein [Mycobacteroides abscessus subsp. abscessus]|nr:Uncharacterised protein [Mycobacteroides abscessus subsp. abscessus]
MKSCLLIKLKYRLKQAMVVMVLQLIAEKNMYHLVGQPVVTVEMARLLYLKLMKAYELYWILDTKHISKLKEVTVVKAAICTVKTLNPLS